MPPPLLLFSLKYPLFYPSSCAHFSFLPTRCPRVDELEKILVSFFFPELALFIWVSPLNPPPFSPKTVCADRLVLSIGLRSLLAEFYPSFFFGLASVLLVRLK